MIEGESTILKEKVMSESMPTTMTPRQVARQADNEALSTKASAVKEAVADLAGEAKHYAAARVGDAKDVTVGWARTGKEKVTKAGETTVDYVQRNPYQALAIAAGIGFVAGLILKRR
jgi:ElaB/YqjD/DUF883 family membrane-anchored ribosome-binding protein